MNLTHTYSVVVCAECGAQYGPGNAASDTDPCLDGLTGERQS